MLPIDPVAAFALCGLGAALGALLLRLVRAPDADTRQGVTLVTGGFVCIAVGMGPLLAASPEPARPFIWLGGWGGVAGTLLSAWGFRVLAGGAARWPAVVLSFVAVSALMVGMTAIEPTPHDLAFGRTIALAFGAIAAWGAWSTRRMLSPSAPKAEWAVGLCVLTFAVVCALRAGFTLAYDGPPLRHEVYVPAPLLSAFAAYFGTLPPIMALLVLNLVNSRLHERLRDLALHDPLTGVLTRRALEELAPALIRRADADGRPIAAMMLDLDHFKAVNDQHGHAVGDEVLRRVADTLKAHLRPDALLTRYGGEEFAVVLPVDDERATRLVAERLCVAVQQSTGPTGAGAASVAVTLSAGVAWVERGEPLLRALARADGALYRAKRDGRNRVEFAVAAIARPAPGAGEAGGRS